MQDGEWSTQEILEGIRNWAEGHHYDILVKTLSAFCLRPENLPELQLKSCGLISRLYNVEFMVCYSWKCLCRSTMKKSKWYGKKYKLYSLERKMYASKLNVTDNACTWRETVIVKEASALKSRDALHQEKGRMPAGQDPVQLSCQPVPGNPKHWSYIRHGVIGFGICSAGFQSCFSPEFSYYAPFLLWNGNGYYVPLYVRDM